MIQDMVPGRDGLMVEGWDEPPDFSAKNQHDDQSVVKVQAGDAILFYNYEYEPDAKAPFMAWRSLHAAMSASKEKWIATNWIDSDCLFQKLQLSLQDNPKEKAP
jgi:hypothetical protein